MNAAQGGVKAASVCSFVVGESGVLHGVVEGGPFAKRRKFLLELVFGTVPMVQSARISVKVHFLRDVLMVTLIDNRARLALMIAFMGGDAALLREFDDIQRVCKRTLQAIVRKREDVNALMPRCVEAMQAIQWLNHNRVPVGPSTAMEELQRGVTDGVAAQLCARIVMAILSAPQGQKLTLWMRGRQRWPVALGALLEGLSLEMAANFVSSEPPRALEHALGLPDDVRQFGVSPMLESAARGICAGMEGSCLPLMFRMGALLARCKNMSFATDVMVEAARIIVHREDLVVVIALARRAHECDEDLADALDGCLEMMTKK